MGASSRPDARATRLAAAGAVGASVVHELRNALAVVSSSLYLARRDRAAEDKLLLHLEKASAEVRRAQAVVAAVLGLARGDALVRETTKIAELVKTARSAVVLPTNVTFSTAITPHDLEVACDPVLLERVLSNLYLNAIEALAGRGRGAITTTVARRGEVVELVVEDDGPGVDPPALASIFDPLFTTKETGTGLGLALVRAVAEAHGGTVAAGAREGALGARFVVTIPALSVRAFTDASGREGARGPRLANVPPRAALVARPRRLLSVPRAARAGCDRGPRGVVLGRDRRARRRARGARGGSRSHAARQSLWSGGGGRFVCDRCEGARREHARRENASAWGSPG